MRHIATRSPLRDALGSSLREPAGLVCLSLMLAMVAVVMRIAAVW
jgi:hypothetical protein